MKGIHWLLIFLINFILKITNVVHGSYYSTKTPYEPLGSANTLPLPPEGFELVCSQMVSRHGCRALEGRKYDKLTAGLWTKAKNEDALTEYGKNFGRNLADFIKINNELGRGELSGLGKIEHKNLAGRLVERLSPLLRKLAMTNSPNRIRVVSSGKSRTDASLKAFVSGLPPNLASVVDYEQPNPALLAFHENVNYQTYMKHEFIIKNKIRSIQMQSYSRQMSRHVLKRLYKSWFVDNLIDGNFTITDQESGKSIKNEVDAARMLHNLYLIGPNLREEGAESLLHEYFHQGESAWFAYLHDAKEYYEKGPSFTGHTVTYDTAQVLLNDLIYHSEKCAQNSSTHFLRARFGHGETIIPLAALLEIPTFSDKSTPENQTYTYDNNHWRGELVSPMAANIQLDVYRNVIPGKHSQILVRMLLNEYQVQFKRRCKPYSLAHHFFYTIDELKRCYKSLYKNLDTLDKDDWQTLINIQRMWMGECNGINIIFKLSTPTHDFDFIETFTTKPDNLLETTHLYIRSNHKLARSELIEETKTSGKRLRIDAVHPLTNHALPIFINDDADYGPKGRANNPMLSVQIGTPTLNDFDLAFVNKHHISNAIDSSSHWYKMNSDQLSAELRSKQLGGYQTSGKLNDWCVSRQRYWGTPIPIIHCDQCGTVPVPENQLPVQLPSIKNIKASSKTGISPLATAHEWIKTECPKCGNKNAQRETDTMDTFVDSSWYFLRYIDNNNQNKPFETTIANTCMPVDLYIGGLEHALTHLFVARFIQHFMHSKGLCNTMEPFKRFIPIGMVQGKTYKTSTGQYVSQDKVITNETNKIIHSETKELLHADWEKMSKSKYNGTDPQDIIDQYGVDFTRMLMLNFVHPRSLRNFTLGDGIADGLQNWFKALINLYVDLIEPRAKSSKNEEDFNTVERDLREQRLNTIYNVSFFIESFFSVASAIIELQKFTRYLRKIPYNVKQNSHEYKTSLCDLLVMIGPVIPCLSSELWTILQNQMKIHINNYDFSKSLFEQNYPQLPDDYPGKINALFDANIFISIPISRSILPSLTSTDALKYLNDNDKESQMKIYIETNGIKFDRLRKLGDYCVTLIYERDPTVPIIEQDEKKKAKGSKTKIVS